jgi:cell division septation protein DedD
MADHSDRDQGPDDLYDEAAPRSIFAATWFRAVLVLIVLGVIGAVAVPFILDAMNAPPGKLSASATAPAPVAAPSPPPVPPPAVAPTPSTPPSTTTPPPASAASDTPLDSKDKKEATLAQTKTTPEPAKVESATPPKPATQTESSPAVVPPSQKPPATMTAKATTPAARRVSGRQWFVQVGAFKDAAAAKKVAAKLREDKYTVDEWVRGARVATVAKATTVRSSGADRYDVIVSGQSPAELNERLAAKNLTAETAPAGAVVKPSLPLREAVALSKELAVDGLKVQVRRSGRGTEAASEPSRTSTGGGEGDGLHRVAVGGFPDRATAAATLKELEAKGYKPFITRR